MKDQLITAARNFACSIYSSTPNYVVKNPYSDVVHSLWDEVCGTNPSLDAPSLPPVPVSQVIGGQCECAVYDVGYTLFQGVPFQDAYIEASQSVRLLGKIGRWFSEQTAPNNWELGFYCRGSWTQPCQPYPFRLKLNNSDKTRSGLLPYIRINTIVRFSGGADNCGNSPPNYPTLPSPDPSSFTSPPVAITYEDNSVKNFYFRFSPPVNPPTPSKFVPPIVVNYFNATISPSFEVPIEFNFDGTINIGSPEPTGFNSDDRDTINQIDNSVVNLIEEVTNIDNSIKETTNINNNAPVDPSDYAPSPPPLPPGEREKDYLAAVEITLTKIPVNAKTQSGSGSPDVVYAGWFEFRREGKALPRDPIHFQQSVFLAPKGVDGYAWTLYNGFEGVAKEIINKEVV